MDRRSLSVVALTALLLACDPLARTELTLSFDETGERVALQIVSDKDRLNVVRAATGDRIGEEILAGRDEWSVRLSNAGATEEQLVLNRSRREVTRVEHRSVIAANDLQAFFFDIGASVQMTRGEGWAELTIYPGASTRATRQQRESLLRKLESYSLRAVRYFEAVRMLYAYMDNNPPRTETLFLALYSEDADQPVLSEGEGDLVAAVRRAVDGLGQSEGQESERELGIVADLVYNPFPARISVVIPTEPLLVEGFGRQERSYVIATPLPSEAIWRLEGRWIQPDPVAATIRAGDSVPPQQLAAELAATERRAAAVVAPSEVLRAVIDQLRPAPHYRVRWITKAPPTRPES